jgi:hypothetical protein
VFILAPISDIKTLYQLRTVNHSHLVRAFKQNFNEENWPLIFWAFYLVNMRKPGTKKSYLPSLSQRYAKTVPSFIFNREFGDNIIVLLGYCIKFGMSIEDMLAVGFYKFSTIACYLNMFTEEDVQKFFTVHHTIDQILWYAQQLCNGKIRQEIRVHPQQVYVDKVLHLSKGQDIFLEESLKKYKTYYGLEKVIPLENFILHCIRNFNNKKLQSYPERILPGMFAKMNPQKILQIFAQVYPDITIIAQYPYIR